MHFKVMAVRSKWEVEAEEDSISAMTQPIGFSNLKNL